MHEVEGLVNDHQGNYLKVLTCDLMREREIERTEALISRFLPHCTLRDKQSRCLSQQKRSLYFCFLT